MDGSDQAQEDGRAPRAVFISYATADRKRALSLTKSIEGRGIDCWISTRDVAPGENYQEAIVRALRDAPAMVLIFSSAANRSDEIKKELSLASRYRIPVIALRIEDVEPDDAFAYELSTRQWIDALGNPDKSIDALIKGIAQASGGSASTPTPVRKAAVFSRRRAGMALAAAMILLVGAAAWYFLRPAPVAAHSMTVRLAGFQPLSADLPASMRAAVDAEIAAAFNADGVVGVSTASAPASGNSPAYALGGTIQRDGEKIRVITRLINERSGETLWSDNVDYDGKNAAAVPRHIAVDAGNVVRCGLFGASTYRKQLPDAVLRDYLLFCEGHWDPDMSAGRKALVPAQRVVAAVPDFSWGWAAVAGAYWKVAWSAADSRFEQEARANGKQAADRAVALDPRNSEALYIKATLLDRYDWTARESLYKRAIAARRLDCGCEYHQYGYMLMDVGRNAEAVERLQQANDMLALYVYTPLALAEALVATGKIDESRQHFDAALNLAPSPGLAGAIATMKANDTGDIDALLDRKLPLPPQVRAALVAGYRSRHSQDAQAKAAAVRGLLSLPEAQQDPAVAMLLADLGALPQAFQVAARLTARGQDGPSLFWNPRMRPVLDNPSFPGVTQKLGLMDYWKASHTRPDVCKEQAPPPFCRMI